jgi:hypothetical protein
MEKNTMKHTRIFKVAIVLAAVAGWISIPLMNPSVEAGGVPILVRTAILVSPTGSINPHGDAEYQLYADGHREIEVEIEDVNLPAGTALTATVDGNSIGQIILAADQRGRLKLRTEDGQNVPVTNDGSTVAVTNGVTVLVSGVLGGGGPNPSPTASPSPTSSPSPSPSPTGTPNAGNLFAGLTGGTINGVLPFGYAEFEVHSSRLELEVRVRQVNLAPGTQLGVVVDGVTAGTMILQSDREARLRLRTDRGDTVPPVVAGSTVSIQSSGSAIMNGVFAGFTGPSPSPTPTGTPGPTPSPSPSFGRSFEAQLTGAGLSPPVQSNATGEIKVTLNVDETHATIFGEFHGLGSNQTGARIATTTSNPVTVHDFGIVGGTNGNFASVTVAVSPALVQQLRSGLWFAVITSSGNPGGEIGGQLIPRSNVSDFDGNGRNDFAVFRPSTGVWYMQNEEGFGAEVFGSAGDRLVSGDYDGDGRTDIAVYKNVNGSGVWDIKRSSDNGLTTVQFGLASDVPARGDFDGDGRADLAVFRPSTGVWYIQRSLDGGYTIVQFGLSGDIPIPADMDGDGRDDIVVFRPSTGVWYWLLSKNGQFGAAQFGLNGDIPVKGDFDGDSRQDLTVFRPSTGVWYTMRSTDGGFNIVQFGLNGDIPVAGNYDLDGRTDIAVFRPSDGYWYMLRSTDGAFEAFRFGLGGDIPVIAQ